MEIGKCCFDCIFCIMANVPIERAVEYTCIDTEGKKHFSDIWDIPCGHFKEAR